MKATFVLRPEEANEDFLQRFRQLFAGKLIKVTVEEVADTTPDAERQRISVQREVFRNLEALREDMTGIVVLKDINLSKLADEMLDVKF